MITFNEFQQDITVDCVSVMSHSQTINSAGLKQLTGAYAHSTCENQSKSKRRCVQPGRKFFLTLSVEYIYKTIRQDFVDTFDGLVCYCVAIEKSDKSEKVSNHIHAYLEFEEKMLLTDLREFIDSVFECNYNLQSCKSKRNVLKYISKEDVNLLTNIKSSEMHFNYRVYLWAESVNVFRHNHPFVVEHRFCYRYLEQYFKTHQLLKGVCFEKFDVVESAYANWSVCVAEWWNSAIGKFVHKRKCLYLYGPPNTGKSSYAEMIIGRRNLRYVYYPGVGKFFMQDYDSMVHRVIVFEEFDIKFHCVSMLKRLLEGKPYAYPVKCKSDNVIVFKGPIIFISNSNSVEDDALSVRLLFVSAETPFWEGEACVVPKAEVEDEKECEETIIVSSEGSSAEEDD